MFLGRMLKVVGVLVVSLISHFIFKKEPKYVGGHMLHYSPGTWRDKFSEMTNKGGHDVRVSLTPNLQGPQIREMIGAARTQNKQLTAVLAYGNPDAYWLKHYDDIFVAYGHGFKYIEVWNEPDKFTTDDGRQVDYAKLWRRVNKYFRNHRSRKQFIPAATVNFVQSDKVDLNIELMKDLSEDPFNKPKMWNLHFYGPAIHKLLWRGWKLLRAGKKYGIEKWIITEFGTGDPKKQAFQINVMLPVVRAMFKPEIVHWYEFAWDKRFMINREYV
jgi:hypothetical protein